MNPIIFYGKVENGILTIPLSQTCKCLIGLVSIQLPNINRRGHEHKELNIYCDQIDSSMSNRKRLLRRICIDNDDKFCSRFEFHNVLYFPVDSVDSKLTIRIHDQAGPIEIPQKIHRRFNMQTVTVCLDVIMDNVPKQWIKKL